MIGRISMLRRWFILAACPLRTRTSPTLLCPPSTLPPMRLISVRGHLPGDQRKCQVSKPLSETLIQSMWEDNGSCTPIVSPPAKRMTSHGISLGATHSLVHNVPAAQMNGSVLHHPCPDKVTHAAEPPGSIFDGWRKYRAYEDRDNLSQRNAGCLSGPSQGREPAQALGKRAPWDFRLMIIVRRDRKC